MRENTFPDRLPIGGRRSIMVPKGHFFGHPERFNFKQQLNNYQKLKEVLGLHGIELTLMSACPRQPDDQQLRQMRFVVIAGDVNYPQFIWEKYEGNNPRGAQNRVYVSGQMLRTSEFIALAERDPFKLAILLTDTEKERQQRKKKVS
jgi:hypothetical protein